MVRKVKSYLDGLRVVDSESELDRLSYDIEPQQAGECNAPSDIHRSVCRYIILLKKSAFQHQE